MRGRLVVFDGDDRYSLSGGDHCRFFIVKRHEVEEEQRKPVGPSASGVDSEAGVLVHGS